MLQPTKLGDMVNVKRKTNTGASLSASLDELERRIEYLEFMCTGDVDTLTTSTAGLGQEVQALETRANRVFKPHPIVHELASNITSKDLWTSLHPNEHPPREVMESLVEVQSSAVQDLDRIKDQEVWPVLPVEGSRELANETALPLEKFEDASTRSINLLDKWFENIYEENELAGRAEHDLRRPQTQPKRPNP